ncbi:MAG TPA: hypothetical protein VN457_02450 [Chlamydiales bacterium]|nr:hypothetical protein [Chlamydiales bacterium]
MEWATASPAPFYNFAITPTVHSRDPFWVAKQEGTVPTQKPKYEEIHMPKNSPMGFFIAACSFFFGFGVIWHILWMSILGLLSMIGCAIWRLCDDDTDYYVTAEEVEKIETEIQQKKIASERK